MARKENWYFKDYQPREVLGKDGKNRTQLVYEGDWYSLPETAPRRLRWLLPILNLAATLLFLTANLFPSGGGLTRWVGVPCLLTLVPIPFLWMGLVNFLLAKDRWTYRQFYSGYRRMKHWGFAQQLLGLIPLGTEIAYLCRDFSCLPAEMGFLLALIGAQVCLIWAAGLYHRYPVKKESRDE